MKNIIYGIITLIIIFGVSYLTMDAVARSEKAECLKWQAEAEEYSIYYITGWQKAQCDTYGVEIGAPVR